jgi:hypothetical protein
MTILALIIGLLIGGLAGFLLCAMMCAAGSADRDADYLREIRLRGDGIAAAMKKHGLELDNGSNPGHIFMRWTDKGWLVYEVLDYEDALIYQGGDLGEALAALVGVKDETN